jgi:rhodanese-related sulfurtransferase
VRLAGSNASSMPSPVRSSSQNRGVAPQPLNDVSPREVRAALLERREIALLDVREEDPYAQAHPLWAANLPAARIELDAWGRVPRLDTSIVLYGDDDGRDGDAADVVRLAAARLQSLGYTHVSRLAGGLEGWRESGSELFRDVNVPSKAFGEWVDAHLHTPSLPAEEVDRLIASGADVVVLDARRFDEYRTMSIPGAISVPGAELALRVRDLAPDPATRVIVNCAGRTRSIVGTQSLINAGVPNPVAALRNGTIGWTLAGLTLERGAERRFSSTSEAARRAVRANASAVAERAGVQRIGAEQLARWLADRGRTTYRFDVRTPEEYAAAHRRGFRSAPGGQLVQETDVHAPVRGARIVLADDDGADGASGDAGVRADMTASWLAQMGWEVAVLEARSAADAGVGTGADAPPRPAGPVQRSIGPTELAQWIERGEANVVDVDTSANYVKGHIAGAWFALRSQLGTALQRIAPSIHYVVTDAANTLAPYVAGDLRDLLPSGSEIQVWTLAGGTAAWVAAGLSLWTDESRLASPRIDRYRRPYEGTDNAHAAMQAYLDWEYGLVAQLERDGTHHFRLI